MRIPIIIDTDPGVDDAIAIFLANSCDKLDIKAITTVGGNVCGEKTFRNARSLANFIDLKTTIARGADKSFIIENEDASWVHGETGMGKLSLPLPDKDPEEKYAWDVIYEESVKESGKMVIVAIAPLTNVATAILKYPDLKKHVKEIRLMGGSVNYGNHSPYGEFNIWGDPHAAKVVFNSGIPITMVGLNVTTKASFDSEDITEIRAIDSKIKEPMNILFDQMELLGKKFGFTYMTIHDALTIASLIDDTVIESKSYYVSVETRSGLNMGRTIVDFNNISEKKPNVTVAMNVDRDKFIKLIKDMMKKY